MKKQFVYYIISLCVLFIACSKADSNDTFEYNSCCGAASVDTSFLDSAYVYIPNVFTPNGDGINDYFRPFWSGEVKDVIYMIVYSLEDKSIWFARSGSDNIPPEEYGWDGIRRDTMLLHKGGFGYEIAFFVNENFIYTTTGMACSIHCGPEAAIFNGRPGCFYPNQAGANGNLNPLIANGEKNCFK